jgi:hypothetical protein
MFFTLWWWFCSFLWISWGFMRSNVASTCAYLGSKILMRDAYSYPISAVWNEEPQIVSCQEILLVSTVSDTGSDGKLTFESSSNLLPGIHHIWFFGGRNGVDLQFIVLKLTFCYCTTPHHTRKGSEWRKSRTAKRRRFRDGHWKLGEGEGALVASIQREMKEFLTSRMR